MARMDFSERDACQRGRRRKPLCLCGVERLGAPQDLWTQPPLDSASAQPAISYLTIFIHRREYICTGMDSYSL